MSQILWNYPILNLCKQLTTITFAFLPMTIPEFLKPDMRAVLSYKENVSLKRDQTKICLFESI